MLVAANRIELQKKSGILTTTNTFKYLNVTLQNSEGQIRKGDR